MGQRPQETSDLANTPTVPLKATQPQVMHTPRGAEYLALIVPNEEEEREARHHAGNCGARGVHKQASRENTGEQPTPEKIAAPAFRQEARSSPKIHKNGKKNHPLLTHPLRLVACVFPPNDLQQLADGNPGHVSKVGVRRGTVTSPSPNTPFQTVRDTFASYGFPTDHPEDLRVHLFSFILDE